MFFDVFSFVAIALASALPLMFRERWWDVLSVFGVAGAILGFLVSQVCPNHPLVVGSMPVILAVGWTIAAITDWLRNPPQRDGTRPVTGWMMGWVVGAWTQVLVFLILAGSFR